MTSDGAFLIVVGLDGSEHSQTALNWAVEEARQRGGQVRLITVWNNPPMAWYPAVLQTAIGEIATEDSPKQLAEKIQTEALKLAAGQGVSVVGDVIHSDSTASAILKAAEDADLVVIGSRGHGGFPALLLGSVSTQVINHAPCPVLVVRPKAT